MLGYLRRLGLLAALGLIAWTGSGVAGGGEDVIYMSNHTFEIPVSVNPMSRREIREIVLLVSRDAGNSWKQVDAITPKKDRFSFHASKDGHYWFAIRVDYKNGKVEPPKPRVAGSMNILVDSTNPDIDLTTKRSDHTVEVAWEIVEENPDNSTLRLEYQTPEMMFDNVWTPVPVVTGRTGKVEFIDPSEGVTKVRMQLRDKAGNLGVTEAIVLDGDLQAYRKYPKPSHPETKVAVWAWVQNSVADFLEQIKQRYAEQLVERYKHACDVHHVYEAKQLGQQALELDPTCFSKKR